MTAFDGSHFTENSWGSRNYQPSGKSFYPKPNEPQLPHPIPQKATFTPLLPTFVNFISVL